MKITLAAVAVLLALLPSAILAQVAVPYHFLSLASTNSTLVVAGFHQIDSILVVNTTTSIYYLKLYDKATAPTCNTDAVVYMVPVPFGASNAGGGAFLPFPSSLRFGNGIGFCLTGAIADNDNTNAATGIAISMGVK
jgi:hypothetical protein